MADCSHAHTTWRAEAVKPLKARSQKRIRATETESQQSKGERRGDTEGKIVFSLCWEPNLMPMNARELLHH